MVDLNKLADAIPDDMKKKVEEELKNAAMSKLGMTNTGQNSGSGFV